jgi:hypothetical protein
MSVSAGTTETLVTATMDIQVITMAFIMAAEIITVGGITTTMAAAPTTEVIKEDMLTAEATEAVSPEHMEAEGITLELSIPAVALNQAMPAAADMVAVVGTAVSAAATIDHTT